MWHESLQVIFHIQSALLLFQPVRKISFTNIQLCYKKYDAIDLIRVGPMVSVLCASIDVYGF